MRKPSIRNQHYWREIRRTMKGKLLILSLVLISVPSLSQDRGADTLRRYTWKYHGTSVGTINVPIGYSESTESYGEGFRTTLKYDDSSFIILHQGTMTGLPLLEGPKYQEFGKKVFHNRIIRWGKVANTELYWREINSVRQWPAINLAYGNVSKNRAALYVRAMNSFARSNK